MSRPEVIDLKIGNLYKWKLMQGHVVGSRATVLMLGMEVVWVSFGEPTYKARILFFNSAGSSSIIVHAWPDQLMRLDTG